MLIISPKLCFTAKNVTICIRHKIVISCFLKLSENVKKYQQNQPTKAGIAGLVTHLFI